MKRGVCVIKIEKIRRQRGITQVELARCLNVSQANISQWENGEAMPRADKLPELARILQCEISDLFEDETA